MSYSTLKKLFTGPASTNLGAALGTNTHDLNQENLKRQVRGTNMARVALTLALAMGASMTIYAQNPHISPNAQLSVQHQEALQQVIEDKASYASSIVSRWEETARTSGKWDASYTSDLYIALMKLTPDNLLAAGEATSFEGMMTALATGHSAAISPNSLGDIADDMVYTPVTPCRIVDTRNAGGIIAANTSRAFDVDGSSFGTQGGYNGSCGIPYGVAQAVAMTITSTGSTGAGYLTAWSVASSQPFSSVLNFSTGQNVANTTIVPTDPGPGNDFYLFSGLAASHAVIDVVGYFAAPVATALDCTSVASAFVAVPVNEWTAVYASCPAGRTATGGGWNSSEGTLGYPGVWTNSFANSSSTWVTWVDNQTNGARSVQTLVTCCRVPGR